MLEVFSFVVIGVHERQVAMRLRDEFVKGAFPGAIGSGKQDNDGHSATLACCTDRALDRLLGRSGYLGIASHAFSKRSREIAVL